MSGCSGHMTEAEARRHFLEHNLKVDLYLRNVTIEEIAAIKQFLKDYRERRK